MIEPDAGWDWTKIQASHNTRRTFLARRVGLATATTIINGVADELVRSEGRDGWFQTFANSVLYDGVSDALHAKLEKGLHQSEGGIFDSLAHLTIRCNQKAFHLYIQVLDPSLSDQRYTLNVTGLSYMEGRTKVDYSASDLAATIPALKVN
jgi:hypothetical protein